MLNKTFPQRNRTIKFFENHILRFISFASFIFSLLLGGCVGTLSCLTPEDIMFITDVVTVPAYVDGATKSEPSSFWKESGFYHKSGTPSLAISFYGNPDLCGISADKDNDQFLFENRNYAEVLIPFTSSQNDYDTGMDVFEHDILIFSTKDVEVPLDCDNPRPDVLVRDAARCNASVLSAHCESVLRSASNLNQIASDFDQCAQESNRKHPRILKSRYITDLAPSSNLTVYGFVPAEFVKNNSKKGSMVRDFVFNDSESLEKASSIEDIKKQGKEEYKYWQLLSQEAPCLKKLSDDEISGYSWSNASAADINERCGTISIYGKANYVYHTLLYEYGGTKYEYIPAVVAKVNGASLYSIYGGSDHTNPDNSLTKMDNTSNVFPGSSNMLMKNVPYEVKNNGRLVISKEKMAIVGGYNITVTRKCNHRARMNFYYHVADSRPNHFPGESNNDRHPKFQEFMGDTEHFEVSEVGEVYFGFKSDGTETQDNNTGSYTVKSRYLRSRTNISSGLMRLKDQILYLVYGPEVSSNFSNLPSDSISGLDAAQRRAFRAKHKSERRDKLIRPSSSSSNTENAYDAELRRELGMTHAVREGGVVSTIAYGIFLNEDYRAISRALIALYICFHGIFWLAGMIETNASTAGMAIIKVSIISLLLTEAGWQFFYENFYALFVDSLDYLMSITAYFTNNEGEIKNFSFLDSSLGRYFWSETWVQIIALLLSGPIGFFAFLAVMYSFLVYFKVVISAIVFYLMSIVLLAVLLAIYPLIMLSLLFKYTSKIFNSWIKVLAGNAIKPVLIFTTIGILNQLMMAGNYAFFNFSVCNGCVLSLKLSKDIDGFCVIRGPIPVGYEAGLSYNMRMARTATHDYPNILSLPVDVTAAFMIVIFAYLSKRTLSQASTIASSITQTFGGQIDMETVGSISQDILGVIGMDRDSRARRTSKEYRKLVMDKYGNLSKDEKERFAKSPYIKRSGNTGVLSAFDGKRPGDGKDPDNNGGGPPIIVNNPNEKHPKHEGKGHDKYQSDDASFSAKNKHDIEDSIPDESRESNSRVEPSGTGSNSKDTTDDLGTRRNVPDEDSDKKTGSRAKHTDDIDSDTED